MDYPCLDNDTLAMWSTAPTGFEYVLFFFVVSRTGKLIQQYYHIGWMSGAPT
jgi:hypothetical protein